MKRITVTLLSLMQAQILFSAIDASLNKAYIDGADAKIIYKIVDDLGVPLSNVLVHVNFRSTYPKVKVDHMELCTDSEGCCVALHHTNDRLDCVIEKKGYYSSFDKIIFSDPREFKLVKDGRWQPYGMVRQITLKKIKTLGMLKVFPNNVRMGNWELPCTNKWIGFDLELFDWVNPFGAGKNSDVLLCFNHIVRRKRRDFEYRMDICFTNNPHAGAYICNKDSFSNGFKFNFTFDRMKFGENEVAYIVRCVDNKNEIGSNEQESVEEFDLKAAKYK